MQYFNQLNPIIQCQVFRGKLADFEIEIAIAYFNQLNPIIQGQTIQIDDVHYEIFRGKLANFEIETAIEYFNQLNPMIPCQTIEIDDDFQRLVGRFGVCKENITR